MPGLGKIARPQKFVIYDIASGFQRPRPCGLNIRRPRANAGTA
jgi:hypothetical protein